MQTIQKTLTLEAHATAKGFSAIVSTEAVDRDGDVVVAQGMNSKDYERNPVLLWVHEDRSPPVGHCTKIRRQPNSIEMDFVLSPRPANFVGEWLPDTLGGLIASKSLRGVSIRFRALPGGARRATAGDIAKYGEACEQVYSKWELLEVSLVSIPANQEALIYAVEKKAKHKPVPVVKPTHARHVIDVRVPLVGADQVKSIASREISRAMGRLFWREV